MSHLFENKIVKLKYWGAPFAFLMLLFFLFFFACSTKPKNEEYANRKAEIFPKYYDLTIPRNIAPLNFIIKEKGKKYRIEIHGENGKAITVQQKSETIQIPLKRWHKLLQENAGFKIYFDIWSYENEKWIKYSTVSHKISKDSIDSYLVYRKVNAVYLLWRDMGIYQRDLSSFDESPIIKNSTTDFGCMNCHAFSQKDPSKMLIHFRLRNAGTMIWNNDTLLKIDTQTSHTMSAGVYPAWHPNGKHIAFSVGKLSPHLTTQKEKVLDVADTASDLIIYNTENNKVTTIPQLSTKRRENMPTWSPDGTRLYFISAPPEESDNPENREHDKYDLMCIEYDERNNSFGEVKMVLSSEETGKSISMPVVSPDGKYIVCAMTDFGYFTIFHKMSDLYSINTETKEFKKLELNSESAESHSSWSSNGRWLVFSSKRIDDVYTRPFIAYFDENGVAHKPFVLPQKNPKTYEQVLTNYNRPELVRGKVELSPFEIRDIAFSEAQKVEVESSDGIN